MSEVLAQPGGKSVRLLDQVRDAIRSRGYSYRTKQAYIQWIKRFIYFSAKRDPRVSRPRWSTLTCWTKGHRP